MTAMTDRYWNSERQCRTYPGHGGQAYFVALYPQMFRPNEAAVIEGVVLVNGRPCFHLRYADGTEDDAPIENQDFVGKGGLGVFYDIRGEP